MASTRLLLPFACLILSASALPGYEVYGAAYHGPPAPLAHDGRVIDTPEVAHAKAAHLAAHAAEAAKATPYGYGDYSDVGKYEDYSGSYVATAHNLYHGPPAPLAHDGRVLETPEVAHAKAAHLAAHAEQISKLAQVAYADPYPQPHWTRGYGTHTMSLLMAGKCYRAGQGRRLKQSISLGVVVYPRVVANGVGHATTPCTPINSSILGCPSHNAGYHKLCQQSLDRPPLSFDNMFRYIIFVSVIVNVAYSAPQWYGGPGYGHGAPAYGHAAPAPLGPDGRVVDTPEVAQLKAAHLSALAEANARAPKGPAGPYSGPAGPYAPGGYAPHYSGPPAPLGPDGRVVDTPEVQQAKAVHFSLYNAEAQKAPAGPNSWNPAGPSWNNPQWNAGNDWNHY
ncbi:pupal cuticle protein-like [Frieseomelitta varia]|uniref:pupal cuticle protein-like n=1 Tax=Frieseomelitta varia TaxID=561572 RepID=UPI001CB6A246|nr:pupal cuticle protein-like [Frieseomelitta varia]